MPTLLPRKIRSAIFSRNDLARWCENFFAPRGARTLSVARSPSDARSHLVVTDPRGLPPVCRAVDLEVCEECGRLTLQQAESGDGEPAYLQLGPFPRAELEHGAPRARVAGHHDLGLRRIREHPTRR